MQRSLKQGQWSAFVEWRHWAGAESPVKPNGKMKLWSMMEVKFLENSIFVKVYLCGEKWAILYVAANCR